MKFFDNYEIGVTMPSAIFKVAVTTISVSDDIRAFDGICPSCDLFAIQFAVFGAEIYFENSQKLKISMKE